MKALAVFFAAVMSLLIFEGCNDGGGGGTSVNVTNDTGTVSTSSLDLSGSWRGRYTSPTQDVPLTAKIRQSGDTLIIQTTKQGVGHLLTGTIASSGNIMLTDSMDGETWTSYGQVTENNFLIRDYLYKPELGSDSPEQDIYLSR